MSARSLSRRGALKYLVAGATAGLAISAGPRVARAAPLTLRCATVLTNDPENSAAAMWFGKFDELVGLYCNNEVKVQLFPDSQLGKESDVVASIKLGVIDMSIGGSSVWGTVVPEIGMLDLGYIFRSWDGVREALDGPTGEALSKLLLEKAGAQVLGWHYSPGVRNVLAKSPFKTPAELAGRKIRVLPVPNFIQTLKLMGAVATPLPLGEVYTALQAGVMDGMEHDAPTVLAGKYYESAKYYTLTNHIFNAFNPLISTRSLQKIPAQHRDGFLRAGKEAAAHARELALKAETKALGELKTRGLEVSDCDREAFRNMVKPLWAEFATKNPSMKPYLDSIVSRSS
ncbi:tripartite ATP-independent transporter DctP family solute receptor [Bradyrhizobium sp. USDA 4472]